MMTFTIEEYKRKLQVRAAQTGKRHAKGAVANADFVFDGLQKQYLDFCVDKTLDPDHNLLTALKTRSFVLQLDVLSEEELSLHMAFLQKTKELRQIALSLSSASVSRDVKRKFERLGLAKSPAFKKESAASILRSVCAVCTKSPNLTKLQLRGIFIAEPLVALLSKALTKCDKLEAVDLRATSLGDKGIEAISFMLGKRPRLLYVNLSACALTSGAKDHLAKIITLHGTLRDEAAWSSSLRGGTAASMNKRPTLIMDLSRNTLGDAGIETLCDALYHDKWVLGLNLVDTNLTISGLKLCHDIVVHNNSTVSVLKVNSEDASSDCEAIVRSVDSLTSQRLHHLQAFGAESNERCLFLCNLLLEWNVEQDIVLQLCNDSQGRKAIVENQADRLSNQDSQYTDQDEDDGNSGQQPRVASSTDTNHIHTIKFLVDRLSAMEAEQQKTAQLVDRLEEENHRLRAKIKTMSEKKTQDGDPHAMEASVIAQLEASIMMLSKQIQALEHERHCS